MRDNNIIPKEALWKEVISQNFIDYLGGLFLWRLSSLDEEFKFTPYYQVRCLMFCKNKDGAWVRFKSTEKEYRRIK